MKKITILAAMLAIGGLIVWFISSSVENSPYQTVDFEKRIVVRDLSLDTTAFFYQPYSIRSSDHGVIVADKGNNRILSADPDLVTWKSIGQKGQGPGRLMAPTFALISGNRLVVAENGNQRVQYLDTLGNSLGGFRTHIDGFLNFAIDQSGFIHMPKWGAKDLVEVYDSLGSVVRSYGSRLKRSDPQVEMITNAVSLAADGHGSVFAAFYQEPMLRKYSEIGELQWERDLTEIEVVRSRHEEIVALKTKHTDKQYNLMGLIQDVCCHDGNVYLLVIMSSATPLEPTSIIGLHGSDGSPFVRIRIVEDDLVPSSICLLGDRLYIASIWQHVVCFGNVRDSSK